MLNTEVTVRIREYIESEVRPRDRQLSASLQGALNQLGARGLLNSGAMWRELARAGRDELAVRASIIWTAIRRAYVSLGDRRTPTTLDDLMQQIAEHVTREAGVVTGLSASLAREQGTAFVREALNESRREWITKLEVEAKFFVDDLKRPARPE